MKRLHLKWIYSGFICIVFVLSICLMFNLELNAVQGAAVTKLNIKKLGYQQSQSMNFSEESEDDTIVKTLNGEWKITNDPDDIGLNNQWYLKSNYPLQNAKDILVPGTVYEAYSQYSGVSWYYKEVSASELSFNPEMKQYIKFNAVQYSCDVWLNGEKIGNHIGSDSPFEIDITGKLNKADNYIVVRVFNPPGNDKVSNGASYNVLWSSGGIVQPANIYEKSKIRITDVYVIPDWKTGEMDIIVSVENNTDQIVDATARFVYGEHKESKIIGAIFAEFPVQQGHSKYSAKVKIDNHKLWSTQDPFLYQMNISLSANKMTDEYIVNHIGFRDFRTKDGFFYLNGKKTFLSQVISILIDPINVQTSSRDLTLVKKELDKIKQGGFNVYRCVGFAMLPEVIDMFDEMGIMLINEHSGGWMGHDFGEENFKDIIIRDRNRPSVVAWGVLNEIASSRPKYQKGKEFLTELRKLDEKRLVLLNSGRWDGEFTIASISNADSKTWDVYLGGESPDKPTAGGDIHFYSDYYPYPNRMFSKLANESWMPKPIYISECGVSGMINPFNDKRNLDAANVPIDSVARRQWNNPQIEVMNEMFYKYSLNQEFQSPEQIWVQSNENAIIQKNMLANAIRSNKNVNGWGITSIYDVFGISEGFLDAFKNWKPGQESLIRDVAYPLRWCILLNNSNSNIFSGQALDLNVSLADYGVLPKGNYTSNFIISNSKGDMVQSIKNVPFTIEGGDDAPFAYKIINKKVTLNIPEGKYKVTAKINGYDGYVAASTYEFYVMERENYPDLRGYTVTLFGDISQETLKVVTGFRGATTRKYVEGEKYDNETILVGSNIPNNPKEWQALYKRIAEGANAIFLDPTVFSTRTDINKWLAVEQKGKIEASKTLLAALYTTEIIAKNTEIFKNGLQSGVMNPVFYGENLLNVKNMFRDVTVPDQVEVVGVYTLVPPITKEPYHGLVLGTYNHFAGKFTINTMDLNEKKMLDPAGRRLLLNLIDNGRKASSKVTAVSNLSEYLSHLEALGIK